MSVLSILLGFRSFEPRGGIPRGPKIFFANHCSHFDTLAVREALPSYERDRLRPIAAADYWSRWPLRLLATTVFNAVLIERRKITRETLPTDSICSVLEKGSSVLIFPEGTRSLDGEIGPFKTGLYHIAKRCSSRPLIPVYLENFQRVLPKGELLPIPMETCVFFGEPVAVQADLPKSAFLDLCRNALLEMKRKTQ